jgi:hypothetical protein
MVAHSSTEVEYHALANATSNVIGISLPSVTIVYCDNWRAVQITCNDVFHEWTKHNEIDYHLVRHHLF